ncbi:SPOR domain-containing protein [Desulfosarcina sp.]|nr:SPOR domain-containing protein [Desulfosarcina sp.]
MRVIFLSVILFGIFPQLFSQDIESGQVQIIQDSRVDTLMAKYILVNEFDPDIKGYRIEIFFESGNQSKNKAIDAKSDFVNKFPEVPSYLTFQPPNYKVRVGDFRTKMEADKFLKDIETIYPSAFIVADKIAFPKL